MSKPKDSRITEFTARGKTKYLVRFDVSGGRSGRRQARRTFATLKEAERFLAESTLAAEAGTFVGRNVITLSTAVDNWLTVKEGLGTARPSTIVNYRTTMNGWWIKPYLSRPIQSITIADVESVIATMIKGGGPRGRGLTTRTVAYNIGLLSQVLDRAVRDRLIPGNPIALVEPYKGAESAEKVAFTVDEMRLLWRALPGQTHAAGFALTLQGLRRSEVLALKFSDVNGDHIKISSSRVEVGKKETLMGATKSNRSQRRTRLLPETLDHIRESQKKRAAIDGFIEVDVRGEPIRPEAYSDAWRTFVRSVAGVRDLDLKAVRRGSVTAMRDAGIPDHIVAGYHGHSEQVMKMHYTVIHDSERDAATTAMATVYQLG